MNYVADHVSIHTLGRYVINHLLHKCHLFAHAQCRPNSSNHIDLGFQVINQFFLKI